MRSVAIIGFSEKTMKYCLTSKADEKWSLNHIYTIMDFPKVTRLFEMHKEYWYLRKEIPKSVAYREWLKMDHGFPIYMQESEIKPDIPSSTPYPLDEIIEDCLPGLIERDENKNETIRKYFTSSFAYMMALAIHEKFDVIELYGIDMENNTEYGYQKPCGEFWIGIALGRGIKVILPKESLLCDADLYGYETVPYVDVNRLKEILKIYQLRYDDYYVKMQEVAKELTLNPDNEELSDGYMVLSGWVYLHDGAIKAALKLIEESDSYISRQYVDMKRQNWVNGLNYWLAMANQTKALHLNNVATDRFNAEDWQAYLDARANMYRNYGAIQLHQQVLWTIDMRRVVYELAMDIKEDDEELEERIKRKVLI